MWPKLIKSNLINHDSLINCTNLYCTNSNVLHVVVIWIIVLQIKKKKKNSHHSQQTWHLLQHKLYFKKEQLFSFLKHGLIIFLFCHFEVPRQQMFFVVYLYSEKLSAFSFPFDGRFLLRVTVIGKTSWKLMTNNHSPTIFSISQFSELFKSI